MQFPPSPPRRDIPPERLESTSSRAIPDPLQNFLSDVGVVNAAPDPATVLEHDETSVIFESYFDLTQERLSYVFNKFDTDEDGRISYESLRSGILFHTGKNVLDEPSFQYLIQHLDLDHSGDVSFEEFSEGLRLLMLRSLFRTKKNHQQHSDAMIQVFDYDAVRLESYHVEQMKSSRQSEHREDSLDLGQISAKEFYFQPRPEWVKTRWIHVSYDQSRASASITMNRLAVKYLLHPLALEDALSPETHRPKAELYSDHYFIMLPVFYIEWIPDQKNESSAKTKSFLDHIFPEKGGPDSDGSSSSRHSLPKIRTQMTSIFVNVPRNDTIITLTSGSTKDNAHWRKHRQTEEVTHHPLWERVRNELGKSYSKLRQYDAQYLTYALLDEAVDLINPIMTAVRREIETEASVLRKSKFRNLDRIQHLRRELERVGRKFKPFVRLLTHVIEDDAISPGATVYLRDVLDNLECSDEDLRQLISECDALDVEADKMQSRQMDQTLYTLTVVSAVFLPAQFLTGGRVVMQSIQYLLTFGAGATPFLVWGMNFEHS